MNIKKKRPMKVSINFVDDKVRASHGIHKSGHKTINLLKINEQGDISLICELVFKDIEKADRLLEMLQETVSPLYSNSKSIE